MTLYSTQIYPSDQPQISSHNQGVLIADDNHFLREILIKVFALHQIPVLGEASNGLEAVSLAQSLRPAVVLLDLHMSKLNGLSAIQQIKLHQPDTKVIVYSADDALKNHALDAGADAFLLKGTDLQQLVASILT